MKILRRLGLLALLSVVAVSVAAWLPTTEQKAALLSNQKPTWQWDFARTGALPPGSTFSRTSGARQYLSDGTLGWAPENVTIYSENQSSWSNFNITASQDGTLGPGTATQAYKLTANAGAGNHGIFVASPTLPVTTQTWEFWIRVKKGTTQYVTIGDSGDAVWHAASFDFDAGAWAASPANVTTRTPVSLGNGWWLLGLSYTTTTSAGNRVFVGPSPANTSILPSFTAAGTESVYVFGAWSYRTPNASTAYNRTASSSAYYGPRFDFDPSTKAPLGYLSEMASTNSITRSQEFDNAAWSNDGGRTSVSANATTAPDGTSTADKLIESAANTYHDTYFGAGVAVTANAPFGISVFAKAGERSVVQVGAFGATSSKWFVATFDLSAGTVSKTGAGAGGAYISSNIRSVGNGWYRLSVIGSINDTIAYQLIELENTNNPTYGTYANSTGYAGDGTSGAYIWGAQFEAGGVGVTSYIPTAGSTVTRAQDVLSLPLTSLPGWSATQGGVLVAAYRLHTLVPSSPGYDQPPASMIDGGVANYLRPTANESGAGRIKFQVVSASASQLVANLAPSTAVFTRTKMAGVWGTARIGGAVDGAAFVGTSGSYSLPSGMTNLYFGSFATQGLNGTLESIAYYRGARSDAFVQGASR